MTTWHVYVEGRADKRFLECLVSHMKLMDIDFRPIGGGISKLHKMRPQLQQSSDEGNRLGIILDANSDCQQCRSELTRIIENLGVRVEKTFLLPDDVRTGCLETLLEELAVRPHQELYNCFEKYQACLHFSTPATNFPTKRPGSTPTATHSALRRTRRSVTTATRNTGIWTTHRRFSRSSSFCSPLRDESPLQDFSTQPHDDPLVRRVGTRVHKE